MFVAGLPDLNGGFRLVVLNTPGMEFPKTMRRQPSGTVERPSRARLMPSTSSAL
jgi:hypothetical protein